MSALVPYNHHGLSFGRYPGPHRRKNNLYYDQRFMGQPSFIPRPFPTQPYFYPNFNRFGQSSMSTDLVSLNRSNQQYQYAQYIRHIDAMQKGNWKREAQFMSQPMYTQPSPWNNTDDLVYAYEKETRYLPYPIFVGPGGVRHGFGRKIGPGYPTTSGYTGGLTTILATMDRPGNLPPKIRVIFMPNAAPPVQQPCTGSLGMPPFLFNRMAQPFCSLPLPPPLPQICSLPLTPAVQQMVAQQYANPIAILPFTQNWQVPHPMTSGYPQFTQPPLQSFAPPSISQPSQYIPQVIQSSLQSFAPTSVLQPSPYIPPPYIPPTLLPSNTPVLPSNAASFPFSTDAVPSGAPYPNNGYPSTCRACVPAPPSLNVPVTGHCWVQHCSACHHVPGDVSSPNNRSTGGRFTPLLRHPTVQQTPYNPPIQHQQYPHINTYDGTRPWLHQMPPLPPGAVVISDKYVDRNGVANTYHLSQNYPIEHPRVQISASRSGTLSGASINQNQRNKDRSGREERKKHKDGKSSPKTKFISTASSSSFSSIPPTRRSSSTSSSSSCSLCKAARTRNQTKSDSSSHEDEQNSIHSKSVAAAAAAARNLNLRYNYQAPDLHSVYNNNHDLKSIDVDSLLLSKTSASSDLLSIREDNSDTPLSSVFLHSTKEEDQNSHHISSPTPPQSERSVKRIIIIRQFRTNSPSTISTVSSSQSFDVLDNDFDSISTTSTIKVNPTNENSENISETF